MVSQVAAFVSRTWGSAVGASRVVLEPMSGGLESTLLRARLAPPPADVRVPRQLVIKQLTPGATREADVYDVLWRHVERPPAVRVLGQDVSIGGTHLYLEDAQPWLAWPWSDVRRAAAVCRVLARLHDGVALPRDAFRWDYEASLAHSARETVALAHDARDERGQRCWPRIGDLRRVAAALPGLRDSLLSGGQTVIHGDVHPGNVILRGPADTDVVLIDWARARVGSPLEDVASWLHALGCWEPEARRRHDTLMRAYLEARRAASPFATDVRRRYWFASASNGLAGAIRYHLAVLGDRRRPPDERARARRALHAWARVVARTAALLRPSRARRS
jgi:hypothetical protein